MDISEINRFLGQDWTDTETLIRRSLDSDIGLLNSTNRALLANGGKQLRPILGLLVARACGGGSVAGDSIRFAAASELMHNATLLHDDVADSSKERRGRPGNASCRPKTGPARSSGYSRRPCPIWPRVKCCSWKRPTAETPTRGTTAR